MENEIVEFVSDYKLIKADTTEALQTAVKKELDSAKGFEPQGSPIVWLDPTSGKLQFAQAMVMMDEEEVK